MAELEGITTADASVILVAQTSDDILLANDNGLIEVARSLDVNVWWVTTLLLKSRQHRVLDTAEAIEVLQALVDEWMNFHSKMYSQVYTAFQKFE